MRTILFTVITTMLSSIALAKSSAYFPVTGDRVMINLQSGHPMSEDRSDQDALRLFQALKVSAENSIMGKGKKVEVANALTIIVADRGRGLYDGTIMIQQGEGVQIDNYRKTVDVRWSGPMAKSLASYFEMKSGAFDYTTVDQQLRIHADEDLFLLSFSQ